MATKAKKAKWSPAQIKAHIRSIQEVIEQHKRLAKPGEDFIAVTPEDIERKLKRANSPMIVSQYGSWTGPTAPGGTVSYNVGIYNPDPQSAKSLVAHVWVGSGSVDPMVGTFLLNVDARFPRLTQPAWPGLTLAPHAATVLSFAVKLPSAVEKTNYLGNCCLMRLWWGEPTYLDRGAFLFTVS